MGGNQPSKLSLPVLSKKSFFPLLYGICAHDSWIRPNGVTRNRAISLAEASSTTSNGGKVIRPRGRAGLVMRAESRARIRENRGRSREATVSASEYEVAGEETVGLGWERGPGMGPGGAGLRREEREIIVACC